MSKRSTLTAGWFAAGLIPALVLMVGFPPLLVALALGAAVCPVSRIERLGLALSPVPLFVFAGLGDGEPDGVWWLAAAVAIVLVVALRFRWDLTRPRRRPAAPSAGA